MVKIVFKNGTACAIIACDHCEDMISDPQEGVAAYPHVINPPENLKVDVVHLHRHVCLEKHISHSKVPVDSQRLAQHMYYLNINTEIDVARLATLTTLYSPT